MREFDFKASAAKLLTNDTGNMLSYIHEYKEQQNLLIETKADVLSHLLEIAKLQSTEASNRIEGLDTSDERIKALVKEKSTRTIATKMKSQAIVMGWQRPMKIMTTFPRPNVILQMHHDL